MSGTAASECEKVRFPDPANPDTRTRRPNGKVASGVGNRPLAALVFSAHGTDVDTVLVNGEVVLRGGELAFEHERQVLADARRLAAETIDRAGIRHRLERHWNPVRDLRR